MDIVEKQLDELKVTVPYVNKYPIKYTLSFYAISSFTMTVVSKKLTCSKLSLMEEVTEA